MVAPRYLPDLTVAQALEQSGRDSLHAFGARGAACVGCYLAALCTLGDVSKVYGFPLDEFLAELDRAAGRDNQPVAGANNG